VIRTGYPIEAADPAGSGLEPAGDGKMWCDDRFRSQLRRAGLTGFEDVMASLAGECLRALEDRENWHLELTDADEQPYGDGGVSADAIPPISLYLKKHHVRTWRSRLRAKLGAGPGETAGRVEAQNVGALTADGIAVMNLVAYGEKLHGDGLIESFVLTEELDDYTELPQWLRRRFPEKVTGTSCRNDPKGALPDRCPSPSARDHDLDRLIRQLALVVRRFHAAGYNHRDLYCCHFFIKEPSPGRFEIRLIDLQRVQRRRWFRRRWLVKDLAQLAWSAPRNRIKCTHKMAFIRHYLGVRKLRPADKRLIREVLARQRVMERRLGVES
jgi:heptose I phosphotransferase